MIKVYTDGGARGNPGPAAIGVYISDKNGKKLASIGKKIGVATNNVAEYKAVIFGLEWVAENKKSLNISSIKFFLDSLLVVSQLNGLYKVRNENLRMLLFNIRQRESIIGLPIRYVYIPREQNKKSDALVNMVLDNRMS